MSTIFTKIANGEIPCYKIAEDTDHFAFLDINPMAEGHVLVIPKVEQDYIFHLTDQSYLSLWEFAKKVAAAIEKSIPCKRVGIAVIGLEVPHTHIHLIPIQQEADMHFGKAKLTVPATRMKEIAQKIQTNM